MKNSIPIVPKKERNAKNVFLKDIGMERNRY